MPVSWFGWRSSVAVLEIKTSKETQNNIKLEDESKDDPSFFIVTYSETVTEGFDYEVPDDREVENPTERLMITMDVSS